MSNLTITESCSCGARYEGAGYMYYILLDVDKFREAHRTCRDRLRSVVHTVQPIQEEEE